MGDFRRGFGAWTDSFADLSLSNAELLNIVAQASILTQDEFEEDSKVKLDSPPLRWLLETSVWGWVAFTAVLTIWGW